MNPFAVPAIVSAVCCGALAAFIAVRVSRTRDAMIFLLMVVLMCAEAMLEFAYRVSDSESAARLCWRINGHWPFILAALLHFVLALTEQHAVGRRPLRIAAIYLPATILCVLEWGWHLVTGPPKLYYWGWSYGPPATDVVRPIAYLWVVIVMVLSAYLVTRAWWRAPFGTQRKRFGWAALGVAIGLGTSVVEIVVASSGLSIPPLSVPAYAWMVIPIGYGIARYEIFELTPMVAAESIIATMSDVLLLAHPEGVVLYANPAATHVTGLGKRALIGMGLRDLLPGTSDWIEALRSGTASDAGDTTNIESSMTGQGGREVPVLLGCTALRGGDGRLRGLIVIARDVSEQQRAREQLNEYKDHLEELVRSRTDEILATSRRLEHEIEERRNIEVQAGQLEAQLQHAQRMEAVGRLAGGVAHDFNNLLTGIVGFAELLLEGLPRDDERRDDVGEILQASNRAGELVQQLLAFSRKQPKTRQIVDINHAVTALQKLMVRIIGANVELRVRPGPGLHLIDIDPTQLEQILVNLIVNARDAMPLGGLIDITTDHANLGEDYCRLHPEVKPGRYVRISIRDSGHGIPPDVIPKIFEPFFTTKEPGKGTGLGLSTVYGLVRQHGGCVEVESELGVGTVFHLHFPHSALPAISMHPAPMVLPRGGGETVLVVDDEPALRRLATRVLGKHGYRVHTASDANQALVELERLGEIDLLITDMIMPGPSGVELARRARERFGSTRVLLMSGYNDSQVQPEASPLVDVQFLQKPFSADSLLERVRVALDRVSGVAPIAAMTPDDADEVASRPMRGV